MLRGSARSGEGPRGRWLEAVRAVLAGMGWTAEPPTGRGNARDRWESLQALVDQAAGLRSRRQGRPQRVRRRARPPGAEQHAPVADGVTVATLHAAKGLEWDAVFVVGVHEGTLPIVYAETPEAVEEERRLLYVGITRARSALGHLVAGTHPGRARRAAVPAASSTGCARRSSPTRGVSQESKSGKKSGCRVCGEPLLSVPERKIGRHDNCPSVYDEELFERLREWRVRTAAEASVPAYVVFTDLTLQAIAEVKPTDETSLLAISGVGPTKWERYGEDVLRVVAVIAEGA